MKQFMYQRGQYDDDIVDAINSHSFDHQLSTFVYNKRLKGLLLYTKY